MSSNQNAINSLPATSPSSCSPTMTANRSAASTSATVNSVKDDTNGPLSLKDATTFNTNCVGCSHDCYSALDTVLCWHAQLSAQYNLVSNDRSGPNAMCLAIFLGDVCCFGFGSALCVAVTRGSIYSRYGMRCTGFTCLEEFLLYFCLCWCCTVCQNHRELTLRGDYPSGCVLDNNPPPYGIVRRPNPSGAMGQPQYHHQQHVPSSYHPQQYSGGPPPATTYGYPQQPNQQYGYAQPPPPYSSAHNNGYGAPPPPLNPSAYGHPPQQQYGHPYGAGQYDAPYGQPVTGVPLQAYPQQPQHPQV